MCDTQMSLIVEIRGTEISRGNGDANNYYTFKLIRLEIISRFVVTYNSRDNI